MTIYEHADIRTKILEFQSLYLDRLLVQSRTPMDHDESRYATWMSQIVQKSNEIDQIIIGTPDRRIGKPSGDLTAWDEHSLGFYRPETRTNALMLECLVRAICPPTFTCLIHSAKLGLGCTARSTFR
jgi:hypothetical protein